METPTGAAGEPRLAAALAATRQQWRRRARQWRAFLGVAARLLPYVQKRAGKLVLALACALGYTLLRLLEPWTLKLIFDNILLGQPLPPLVAPVLTFAAGRPLLLLNILAGALVLMAVLRGVLYFYQQLVLAAVGQQVVADLRVAFFSHLQRLSSSFHDRRRTGDVLMRLTTDITMLRDIFVGFPLSVAAELFLIVGMGVVMALMDWHLALLVLMAVPGLALLVGKYRRPMKEAIRQQRDREGHLATIASEVLGAIKVVQGFRRERYEVDRFSAQNKRSLRSGLRAARLEAKLHWATEMTVATVTAVVLSVAVRRVLGGVLSPGDLLVFFAYLRTFNRPLRRISRTAERTARGTAAGERILEMLNTPPTVRDHPGAAAAPRFRGEIVYDRVSFGYGKGQPVLSEVTLRIAPGERVAIAGPTGAGKTTLVSLVPRFYDPTQGRICIDGRDVREFTLASLRQQISLVFQEPILFAATIAENIAYGKPDATREEIATAAHLAGIHSIITALLDGYDTVIGERGGTLSGGQRQCVAIARAIIKAAPIVILDEPTTGLDGQSAALVMEALSRLMEGRTVLMISHQPQNLRHVDRVVVLEAGHIVEEGNHAALLAHHGLHRRFPLRQAGR